MIDFEFFLEETNDENEILCKLDDELENANYHDFIGLGENIWAEIKDNIPETHKLTVLKAICKRIYLQF